PIRVERMLIDGPDGNGDGLPDDWAAFYGITDPLGDLDQDGLNELTEYQLLSNPWHADSDGDGFYDSVELEWGTDVCGPEKPPYQTQPLLTLFGNQHYNMRTATNQAPVANTLELINFGSGTMNWQVTADAGWLTFDQESGSGDATVTFTADPAGLAPGAYNATITIVAAPPTGLSGGGLQETAEVAVTFVVLPEIGEPDTTRYIFLPIVLH
ncbi:MAG: BACON domain-containing protein, partial [Candidatus Promineifilaceae bacterium]